MKETIQKLSVFGLIPVIKIDDAEKAVPLAQALKAGGLPVAEVTLRTKEGEKAIARITEALPDMLIGAGTVLNCAQADRAEAAGARFVVSPGFNPAVVRHCLQIGMPVIPGVCTPGEMEQAIELGLHTVKFFPAEQSGGIAFIKAVSAPYPMLRFIPTGGISTKNLNDYLDFKKVIACGGSWMAKPELIAKGDFAEITRLTSEAVATMLGFVLGHVGINCHDDAEAQNTANMLYTLFGLPSHNGKMSIFASNAIECMKMPYLGQHGHIGIKTNSVDRAAAYFEQRGFALLPESRRMDTDGSLKSIYFSDELSGFAIHLMLK